MCALYCEYGFEVVDGCQERLKKSAGNICVIGTVNTVLKLWMGVQCAAADRRRGSPVPPGSRRLHVQIASQRMHSFGVCGKFNCKLRCPNGYQVHKGCAICRCSSFPRSPFPSDDDDEDDRDQTHADGQWNDV
ncbi:hypothetical protein HELRODRAFT_170617 [Helobdella robusta]|uniref:Antistasin-like domain-containing protein n=1 Tax=Helobdella robusta TaxID=6412 RepID=T1F389_HELRO|nr:hypothetical protein HELRODRAFT_170617 [Helobdella robusta]ESO07288.1 hypothetical protein HELRODRAFT_170617 [Helobdella robusta]